MTDRTLRDGLERLSAELKSARAELATAKSSRAERVQSSRERLEHAKLERAGLADRCYELEAWVVALDREYDGLTKRSELERSLQAKTRPLSVTLISRAIELFRRFVR